MAIVKSKSRYSMILWITILIFFTLLLTFSKWIGIFYPEPNRDVVFKEAGEYGVDPYLVFAIIRTESKYQNAAESPAGAKGLMQIMPETAQWIAGQQGIKGFDAARLHDPSINIAFGCWYLADLNKEFDGRLPLVIAAYNAGRGRVREWVISGTWDGDASQLQRIPYQETRKYVDNVLQSYDAYRAIYQ